MVSNTQDFTRGLLLQTGLWSMIDLRTSELTQQPRAHPKQPEGRGKLPPLPRPAPDSPLCDTVGRTPPATDSHREDSANQCWRRPWNSTWHMVFGKLSGV